MPEHAYEPFPIWHNTNIPCRHCGELEWPHVTLGNFSLFLDNELKQSLEFDA